MLIPCTHLHLVWMQLLLHRNSITATVILIDQQGISLVAGVLYHHSNVVLCASLLRCSTNWCSYEASASILAFRLTGCGLGRRSEARFSRIHWWCCLKIYNLQCNKYFMWNYWYTKNRNTTCISSNRIEITWAWHQDATHPFTCSSMTTGKSRPVSLFINPLKRSSAHCFRITSDSNPSRPDEPRP
jgi:hypothetical protein